VRVSSSLATTFRKPNTRSHTHTLSRRYLAVPPGPHLLSSVILNSPILAGDRGIPDELAAVPGGADPAGSGVPSQFEFGVDPSLDPELAMALRMSMEEEAARQAAANPPPQPPPSAAAPAATGADGASAQLSQPAAATDENDEALLRQALGLPEGEGRSGPDAEMAEADDREEDLTEEEMIARAIEMSMHPESSESEEK